ncbi:MAG: cob(I)yrinic acid a,c-diamide adenosyltransferase [Firmicutes bacterium]|nr:cob(I)yrinic acid a,c-diamide adenosyltransferase [Bacillota bacterium]
MKLYTKTGDGGETSLIYGKRVAKDDLRVETYGTIDEANSVIGVAVSALSDDETLTDLVRVCRRLQRDLFDLGRDLATPADKRQTVYVTAERVALLERLIDRLDATTPPIQQFILPGGSLAAAHLHHARTVVRRAERLCVSLLKQDQAHPGNGDHGLNPHLRSYLNRLSDLLFAMARAVNHRLSIKEPGVDFTAPLEDVE